MWSSGPAFNKLFKFNVIVPSSIIILPKAVKAVYQGAKEVIAVVNRHTPLWNSRHSGLASSRAPARFLQVAFTK